MSTSPANHSSEISTMSPFCPICMLNYTSTHYPIVSPECGHSICVDCGQRKRSNICFTCGSSSWCAHFDFARGYHRKSPLASDFWKKNFALMDLIEQDNHEKSRVQGEKAQSERENKRIMDELEELKKKMEEISLNDIDYMECPNCKSKEKRERMKICGSCAEEWNKEWKGMKEEEIRPFIICGFCCVEEHYVHSFVKYLPWKMKELVATTVSNGKDTVSSMNEICAHEIEKGKEHLGKWNEKVDSFDSVEFKTYRDGLSIVDSLKNESDLVCRASEDTLPTLRMYTKVVKDSITRLDLFKKGETVHKKGFD